MTAVAAKVDPETGKPSWVLSLEKPVEGGVSCTTYIGANGAGHYVKMVHNGIEYGDMQMICEAYHILRDLLKLEPVEIGKIFEEWNTGLLDSFLMEITADILQQIDPKTNQPLVDSVLDTAGQKGQANGRLLMLDMGVPAPTIAEAVFARCLSALKEERVHASKILSSVSAPARSAIKDKEAFIQAVHDALYCSKICSYAQGFQLMREANKEYGWDLNFGAIAEIFRGVVLFVQPFFRKLLRPSTKIAA